MVDTVELMDRVWGVVLPAPTARTPYTRSDLPLLFASSIPLIVAAHIRIRRPGLPLLVRLPLAIASVYTTIRLLCSHYTTFYIVLASGRAISSTFVDFVAGVAAVVWSLLIIEFLLLGEEKHYEVRGLEEYRQWLLSKDANGQPHKDESNGRSIADKDHADNTGAFTLERPKHFPGCFFPLEIDILASIRGFGYGRGPDQRESRYKAGYSAYLQAKRLAARPIEEAKAIKRQALLNAVRIVLLSYAAVDVIETFSMHPSIFPTVRKNGPSSIIDAANGILGDAGPWVLTVLLCIFIICFMQLVSTLAYVAQLVFTAPADAPITISRCEPLMFARPHCSTSLRDMWGKHWHVYFRRIFLVFGYQPARKLAGRLGAPAKVATMFGVMASFLVSGLMHEMCLEAVLPHWNLWDPAGARAGSIRTAGRGYGANGFVSTRFFLAQGVGIVLEDVWASLIEPQLAATFCGDKKQKHDTTDAARRIVTGRLRSVLGWAWCMTYMAYFGYGLINVWLEHGVAPTAFSLQLSGPAIDYVVGRLPHVV